MDHEVVYRTQIQPLARDPLPHVTTHLICRNTLLRTGIGHILSGSRFSLTNEIVDGSSEPLALPEETPALIILCGSLPVEACLDQLENLKARSPSTRVVILADHLEPQAVVQLCIAGLNGLCPSGMSQGALLTALELVMLGETFLPASVSFELLEQGLHSMPWSGTPARSQAALGGLNKLSERETQILRA